MLQSCMNKEVGMRLKGIMGGFFKPAYAQIDLKNAIIRIKDGGAGTAQQSIEVTIGEGNLTYTERKNIEYTLDRGNLDEVREGDQVPVDISIDAVWEYITGGTATGAIPSIEDALKNRAAAAAWISSDPDACRPYAVDLEIEYLPTPSNCGDKEIITIPDFRYEEIAHDLRAGTFAISGRANVVEATAVRSAQS